MKKLFLTGYERETVESFIKKLRLKKITTVIDVREIPLSRKNGFSKNNLSQLLRKNDIKYYHFPKLGSPILLRNKLRETGDYLTFFERYYHHISNPKYNEIINTVIKLVVNNGESSALLCFEKETDLCHRSIIATKVLERNSGISAIHL